MPRRKERKLAKVGAKFTKKYKDKEYTLTIVESEGKRKYKIGNEIFKTPSGAAHSITKNAINGWVFWGMKKDIDLEDGVTPGLEAKED